MGIRCPQCDADNTSDSHFCKVCATPLPRKNGTDISLTRTIVKPADEILEGKLVSEKYRIQEVIGRGGMGIVYRAVDTKLERNVALKFLPPELKIDEEACQRFVLEAKSAAALSHPNICTIHEIDENEDYSYIVMEYVEGKSLRELLREGPLSLDDVVDIGIQVAEGLDAAHQRGIIHRDIKSANLMVTKTGQTKIMDFGLAKMAGGSQITKEARTVGTIAYMSPEQTRGDPVDHRSDIWSLGVVLYELAVGFLPFRGDRDDTVLFSIRNDEPKPVTALLPDARPAFVQIIKKCLAKDPSNRYQNASELVKDLRSLSRDSKSLITKPKSVLSKARHQTIKIRVPWLISAVFFLSIIASVYFFVFLSSPLTRYAEPSLPLVAVAPFENQTGDPALGRIGVEITELIESGLSQSGFVAVLENKEMEITDQKMSFNSLARNRGVVKLISGAYFLQGENVRFTGKLLDAQKGEVDMALEPVSGALEAPFQAMQTVSQNILGGLASTLDSEFSNVVGNVVTLSYDAWKEYSAAKIAEGRHEWDKVIAHYHKAWELDPTFFYARLREGYLYFAPFVPNEFRNPEKAEQIFRELNESQENLDPLSKARLDFGLARIKHDWESCYHAIKEASRYTRSDNLTYITCANRTNRPREALEILKRPDYWPQTQGQEWQLFVAWSLTYHKLGKHKKALKEVQRGRKLLPDSMAVLSFEIESLAILGHVKEMNLRWDLFKNKNYMAYTMVETSRLLAFYEHEEASLELAKRALSWYQDQPVPEEEPQRKNFRFRKAKAMYLARGMREAEKTFSKLAKDYPKFLDAQIYLGYIAAQQGEREKAIQISDTVEKSELELRYKSWVRANIACQLGDFEAAMVLLKVARENGCDELFIWETYGNVLLKPMLDYPPFKEFMKPKG